ncbi:MAG: single-stranded-DNA-specific exonuclease RecJ [Armatimonadota bacterium]|nr:single-stranded-DNA-specific exonuclease RecJ [Armatimonadota bacterium]
MERKWTPREHNDDLQAELSREMGVSALLARLLVSRGIASVSEAAEFLNPSLDDMHDPYDMPDMERAVSRVRQAMERKEKILVHGDYDVDGISSTALLIRCLRALDANVVARVPHRRKEGYDIKPLTVKEAKADGVSLILTADCGVTACETASHALDLGVDLVVTDHHEPGPELPRAAAVVNPRRRDSTYPFKHLAGVGVAFKFAQALVRDLGYSETRFRTRFLDLVALGTVGDVVPLFGENRTLVKYGMQELAATRKVGLRALVSACGLEGRPLTTHSLGFILAPRINAVGRLDDSAIALQLFLTRDEAEAIDLVGILERHNTDRQREQMRIWSEVSRMLSERDLDGTNVIVLAAPGWNAGVVGIVASKVVEQYSRPAVLISADEEGGVGTGSARSIEAFNIGSALEQCRDVLLRCGGHALAAGVSLRLDKLEVFEEKLNGIAAGLITPEDLIPSFATDGDMALEDLSADLLNELKLLEPYGMGNPEPLFVTHNATVLDKRLVGDSRAHLKLRVRSPGSQPTECIAFGQGDSFDSVQVGSGVDLCYNIRLNQYNGAETVQLTVKDLVPASDGNH